MLVFVTSDVIMNIGPNVKLGTVCNVATVSCLNIPCCGLCTAPQWNSACLGIVSRLELDSGATRT